MQITFVLENFYPTHRAGTETYVLSLAKGLLNKNLEVSVIIAAVGKKTHKYKFHGINVYALNVPDKISTKELNGLHESSNLNSFKKLLDEIKPDIVHFHSFSRSFTHFHIKTAHDLGAKIFFTAHLGGIFCVRGDFLLLGKKQCNGKVKNFRCSACFASQKHSLLKSYIGAFVTLIKPLRRKFPALNLIANKKQSLCYLAKYVHTNIAIAHWIEAVFHQNNIRNTVVLTQAIDTSKFTEVKKIQIINKIQIGFIGRMNPSKGFFILIQALKTNNLSQKFNLEIITIKDEAEQEYYQQMKQEFSQLGYTFWHENIKHSEINTIMNNWDMLILPSISNEAAPLVVLEANAKKIPVIGSDYPAIAEMITNNKNGLLFENGNARELAQILTNLAENLNLIKKLKNNLTKPKDIKDLVKEHLELYKR